MGTPVSRAIVAHIRTILAALAAFTLALCLLPAASYGVDADPVGAGLAPAHEEGSGDAERSVASAATQNSALQADSDGSILASTLAGASTFSVSADVALNNAEPLIGSFTVDSLTYSVGPDGLTLISVDPAAASDGFVFIPASVDYAGVSYPVTSIAPYAFYLSGVTQVELPATITSLDDRAFRSSDVERIDVAAGNPNFASFGGALYSADLHSLLLIPEGRAGAVLLPETAEVVEPSKFSHCSLVDAIAVEEDGANFASWDGLLYDASGETLLRVPAGASEITIREGCTAIAAGAMEGCANLERIHAPATVTSINPDVFASIPTVSLPAMAVSQDESVAASFDAERSVASPFRDMGAESASADNNAADLGNVETQTTQHDETNPGVASSLLGQVNDSTNFIPQLTAMVVLSTTDDGLPEIDRSNIKVYLAEELSAPLWQAIGFSVLALGSGGVSEVMVGESAVYAANTLWYLRPNDINKGHLICTSYRYASGSRPLNTPLEEIRVDCGTHTNFCSGDSSGNYSWLDRTEAQYYTYGYAQAKPGYLFKGWSTSQAGSPSPSFSRTWSGSTVEYWAVFDPISYTIMLDANGSGASVDLSSIPTIYDAEVELPIPVRPGYQFTGWNSNAAGSGTSYGISATKLTTTNGATVTLYAQWKPNDFELGFDVDSEPGDEDYPGEIKPDETVNVEDGQVAIEDPKRPGYVFEGWVIPNADGTEAVDQELVYQDETDGKWYVDASKLPDYAGDDGRVELTARWTSVISVDVPQSVTFYADTVTQGQQSREGRAEGAFGQNKVANQSQVDLRVVGLESSAVKTTDTTFGADSILKKAEAATPSTSAGKLLSLYPSAKQWTAEELQDPEAVSNSKAANAVDFDLDDILLERSFSADIFAIPAGDTLNMGYRLNLAETGQQLDYDKLSTLEDGQSAALANVSYCFAAGAHFPTATGTKDDPLYIEYKGCIYGLQDIKDSAECISTHGAASPCYAFYKELLDAQVTNNGNPGAGPYFKLKVDGVYWDLQLIGICQDTKTADGKKAGLTFQTRDLFAVSNAIEHPGVGTYVSHMNASNTNSGGWESAFQRNELRTVFHGYLDAKVQAAIEPVNKFQQVYGGAAASYLQRTTGETIWLPSMYEVLGTTKVNCNEAEGLTVSGYQPFQYMAYQSGGTSTTNTSAIKKYYVSAASGTANRWWLRSVYRSADHFFCGLDNNGALVDYNADHINRGVAPCFCL